MEPYWDEYDAILTDGAARSSASFDLAEEPDRWVVTQRLADPAGDGEWRIVATVDLALARVDGAPSLQMTSLGRFGSDSGPATVPL